MKTLGAILHGALAFAAGHKSELSAALSFVAGAALPPPYGAALHLAAALLAGLAGTKYGS